MRQRSAASSGLDGLPARAALMFVWVTGVVHGIIVGVFAQDVVLIVAAYVLAVCAAAAITSPPRGRLPLGPSIAVLACSAAIATIVLTSPDVDTTVWLFDFASYPVALLIPRGRALLGGIGVGVLLGAATLWALTTAQPDPSWGRIVSGPLVGGAIGFAWMGTLRRIVARETRARTALERAELRSSAALAAARTFQRELARVAEESDAALREIAGAETLDEDAIRRISVVEGRIRDRLRAADLSHRRVSAGIDAARERGIAVLLIGSGGGRGIGDGLADRILEQLATPGLQSLTVRRLPPGRAAAVSVMGQTAGGIMRAAFDESGDPIDAWLDAVTT